MKDIELNSLVERFRSGRCEDDFNLLFKEVHRRLNGMIDKRSHASSLDRNAVESEFNLKLLETIEKYDRQAGSFVKLLNVSFRNNTLDNRRKLNVSVRNWDSANETLSDEYASDPEEEPDMYDMTVMGDAEHDAITYYQEKHEQQDLLNELLSKTTESRRRTAQALARNNFSYTDAANELGVNRSTVKRLVTKIRNVFDEEKYGSYKDYLTV